MREAEAEAGRNARILIAGANSGCGKTTVTCGILKALMEKGLAVKSFKCGPDYIDPMFHKEVVGAASGNLDLFMTSENTVKYILAQASRHKDITVLEGVMGLYDGLSGRGDYASSNHIARLTGTPVVLVVNGKGMGISAAAVVKGFLELMPNNIQGVIINKVSQRAYGLIAAELKHYFPGLHVLGYLPELPDLAIESRHLGLVTAKEIDGLQEKIKALSLVIGETVDIGQLLAIAARAETLKYKDIPLPAIEKKINIAVAYDSAFCFYYKETIQLLEAMGATISYFSPIEDQSLPAGASGILLGGGYPELYLEALSQNIAMREDIKGKVTAGMPCIAECGGFMYLLEAIDGYPMAGVIKGSAELTKKLVRFGYVTLTALEDSMLLKKGDCIAAHEFHYSDSTANGSSYRAAKLGGGEYMCVNATDTIYAGYPHINLWAKPDSAGRFLSACGNYSEGTLK